MRQRSPFPRTVILLNVFLLSLLVSGLCSKLLVAQDKGVSLQQRKPQKWALLVGVNDYVSLQDLEFCSNDVSELRKQLLRCGFPDRQVFLLHDQAPENNRRPFRSNIQAQLNVLLGTLDTEGKRIVRNGIMNAGDLVLLAFSGHGIQIRGQSYLCPADANPDDPASLISVARLFRQMELSPAKVKLCFLDACRNEVLPRGEKSAGKTQRKWVRGIRNMDASGILQLTSCAAGQVSLEDEKLKHGVFMHYVLKGMQGPADTEGGNRDQRISLFELYTYVSRQTKAHVAKNKNRVQTPELKGKVVGVIDLGRVAAATKRLYRGAVNGGTLLFSKIPPDASFPDPVKDNMGQLLDGIKVDVLERRTHKSGIYIWVRANILTGQFKGKSGWIFERRLKHLED